VKADPNLQSAMERIRQAACRDKQLRFTTHSGITSMISNTFAGPTLASSAMLHRGWTARRGGTTESS
jgi:hypothetical protein